MEFIDKHVVTAVKIMTEQSSRLSVQQCLLSPAEAAGGSVGRKSVQCPLVTIRGALGLRAGQVAASKPEERSEKWSERESLL